MDRKRANKTTSDVPSLRIFGQFVFPSRWKNSSWVIGHVRNFPTIRITKAKWFLTESETLLNQTKVAAAAAVKAGEKIHTMGYNEIMVQVGGETQTRCLDVLGGFWRSKIFRKMPMYAMLPVDGEDIPNSQPPFRCIPKPCKSWDFNYQPQLVLRRNTEPSTL